MTSDEAQRGKKLVDLDALLTSGSGPIGTPLPRRAKAGKFQDHTDRVKVVETECVRLPHRTGIMFAVYSPCNKFIFVATKSRGDTAGSLVRWEAVNINADDRARVTTVHDDDVLTIAISRDSGLVMSASGTIAIAALSSISPSDNKFEIEHKEPISFMSYSRDGRLLISAAHDKCFSIWCATVGRELTTVNAGQANATGGERPHLKGNHGINSAYFSPDGSQVAIACTNGHIALYKAIESQKDDISVCLKYRKIPLEEEVFASDAKFSSDSQRLLIAGWLNAYIWDISHKETCKIFGGLELASERDKRSHSDSIWSAEFSSDERFGVTASGDYSAIIWDAQLPGLRARLLIKLDHPASLYFAQFSEDDSKVLTACDDGNAYLWNIGKIEDFGKR